MTFYDGDDDERTDDDEEQQEKYAQLSVKDLRALRKAAKERDAHAAQLAEMQRELAFAKAGLDLAQPQLKYFVKAYDGEMTPEAIRTAAEEAGFVRPAESGVTDAERQANERMDGAGAGAAGTGAQDPLQELSQFKPTDRDGIMQFLVKQGLPTTWNRPEDR